MQFEINLTGADYIAFQKFTHKKMLNWRQTSLQFLRILLLIVLMFISQYPVPAALIIAFLIAGISPIQRYVIEQVYTKGVGHIFSKRNWEVTETHIRSVRDNYEEIIEWNYLSSMAITSDCIYLMVNPLAGYIIPKRSFVSPETCGEFMELVQQKIPVSS